MGEVLYPYLVATIVTVAVLTAGWFSYVRYQRAAIDHQTKAQRIPDFVRYVQLSDEIVDLEERREQLRQILGQAEATVQEAEEARTFLQQNVDAVQKAREAVDQLKKLEAEWVSLHDKMALDKEENRKLQEALARARFEREEEERRVNAYRVEKEELLAETDHLKSSVAKLQQEKLDLMQEAASNIERSAGLRAEVAGLDARKLALEAEIAKLDARRAEAKKIIDQLEGETQKLTGIKGLLEGKIGTLRPQADEKEKLAELREPVFTRSRLPEPSSLISEQKALETAEEYLRRLRLHFDRRVIYAFHTALKVQGDSPLLVLAGISGTGKSLLPQKYAEALGIHCQVVPVQPRWDGPQDLLGFYHHLEQRFKPTPLTRALVQFDRFAKFHENKDDVLDDQMLLVLLDEMNLARVEYYFSDFLSKLETRREIDAADHRTRSKATFQLDLGARGENVRPFELFVDQNVFFVGTINEDESTQTLSDKVIDRANVIRFGRPNQLVRPSRGDQQDAPASKTYMPCSMWQRWITGAPELSPQHKEVAQKTTRQINDALSCIGRAFAHRTNRAIFNYVQQYPLRTDQGIRQALADQIEQRILPKLRGLDTKEDVNVTAISAIKHITDDLQDTALAGAIDQGMRGHSFYWQGIDRSE
jgi:hypothetical protein